MSTYILDENDEPEKCDDLLKWAEWRATHDQHLLYDVVGDVEVSTVFLSVDYRHLGDGPPILWETMIFGGPHDRCMERYISKLAALQGHAHIVAFLERELAQSRHGHVDNAEGPHEHQDDDEHHHHPDDPVDHQRVARRELAEHPDRQPANQHDNDDVDQ
jgi:hypothetical protein